MTQMSWLDARDWKFCEKCGKELEQFFYKTDVRYDKRSGRKYYRLHVQCPDYPKDRYEFSDPHHSLVTTWITEGDTNMYQQRDYGDLPF